MPNTVKRAAVSLLLMVAALAGLAPQALAQSLMVTITSPQSGDTVTGTVPVNASVSIVGLLFVRGVQFKLDGANLGTEDTAAPYSISWDTRTASNGSHTLTAVASDSLGVHYASAPVTVTVSNAPPPPPPAPATRFEDTDASVAFSAGWTQDARAWSGGSAMLSTTPGAQASFTFTGTSVSWIGGRASSTGIARVFLDGAFVAEVDTFSKNSEEVRVPMFTLHGLANSTHTLTIQVTGLQNPAAFGNYVVVDAFDVPAATISRLQESDPDVAYSAGWVPGDALRPWSAGTSKVSVTQGAQASFAFTGTAVTWVGARGTQTGIARVYLDGSLVAEVDTYSLTEQIQAAVFTASGLADASHALTIEVTGLKNAASGSALIAVDGFDVTSSGIRHQETDPAITYGPGWILSNYDKAYSEGSTAETVTAGAQATFTFTGTSVAWVGARGPQTGIARVYLDGAFVSEIDTYFPTEGPQHILFRAGDLSAGSHTLMIEATGQRNTLSTNAWILVDAFDVTP